MMRAASTIMLLHLATVSGQACSNACSYANDGFCDDGRAGSTNNFCPLGTDCADCGNAVGLATHCTCDNVNNFLGGGVVNNLHAARVACDNAFAGCSFSSRSCETTTVNNVVQKFTWDCAGASAPSAPTSAATGACAGMSNTDHCCKDGAPDDYPCRATYTCGKGTCLRATYKLCTDGPTGAGDYQCSSTETCGRGICVQATKTLCGTSGTKTCAATQTCCGTDSATKNTVMGCNTNMDPCPANLKSDTSYSSAPYKYGGDSSSDSSSIGPIIGGVGE
eukprot:scaffold96894_cov60-Phaeocystis_antarctica.AAC.1